jgi:hypothetical protein
MMTCDVDELTLMRSAALMNRVLASVAGAVEYQLNNTRQINALSAPFSRKYSTILVGKRLLNQASALI